jgi:hypothetical protein
MKSLRFMATSSCIPVEQRPKYVELAALSLDKFRSSRKPTLQKQKKANGPPASLVEKRRNAALEYFSYSPSNGVISNMFEFEKGRLE